MVKIIIKYNKFLDPIFIYWVKGTHKDWKCPTKPVVLRRVEKYRKIWEKHGRRIINALESTSGMKFRRSEIPVYIVSGNPRSFSDPLVMTSRYNEATFLDVLTHELIHCLFVDNRIPIKEVYKLFPNDDETTSAHIPVYAILMDIFKNKNFTKKYRKSKVNESYREAIRIVKEQGYQNILKLIRNNLVKYIDTL